MFDDAPEALDDDELNKLAELTEEVSFLDGFEPPEGNAWKNVTHYECSLNLKDTVTYLPLLHPVDTIEEVIRAAPVLRERRQKT